MRISLKFYSCVGSNHTTLDAIRDIRKRRPFDARRDRRASSCTARRSPSITSAGRTGREGLTSAQLNLPFCVATLLIEGDVFVDEFTPDCVDDDARIKLSRKVKVVHDPAITALGAGPPPQGPRRDPFPRRLDRERDPRGAARQRAVVRQRGRHRRQIPQADPRRHARGAAGCLIDAVLGLDKLPDSRTLIERLRVGITGTIMEFGVFDHLDRTGRAAAGFLRGSPEDRRGVRPRRILRLSSRRASFDAARHGAVAERLSRRGGAAHAPAALRPAGLRAAALSSGAADFGNLHARPDERRAPRAELRPRRLADRNRIFRRRSRADGRISMPRPWK